MEIIYDISSFAAEGTVATVGFFDGVHKGHQFLIEQVKRNARELGLSSLIVTFDQHPRKVLNSDFKPKLLNTFDEKIALLEKTGVDYCCVLPFTKDLAAYSSQRFLKEILCNKLHTKKLIIGHDHRFGHNRSESFDEYRRYAGELSICIEKSEAYEIDGLAVSSSAVRRFLVAGDIVNANKFLAYDYFFSGKVVHGNKIGRSLNFPTANIETEEEKLLPLPGIYAVRAEVRGHLYNGMLNIGTRPSIKTSLQKLTTEVNLFDFDEEIYGETIKIFLAKRIRDEQKFENLDLLMEQLKRDKETVMKIL
jgi:riboflavin kinase/FMN adenylyltransferase